MELTGKYAILELSHDAVRRFVGKEPRQQGGDAGVSAPRWYMIGAVQGETLGVGLWFRLIGLTTKGDEPLASMWKPDAKNVYLIWWSWLPNVTVLPEKPKDVEKMGFRPV